MTEFTGGLDAELVAEPISVEVALLSVLGAEDLGTDWELVVGM